MHCAVIVSVFCTLAIAFSDRATGGDSHVCGLFYTDALLYRLAPPAVGLCTNPLPSGNLVLRMGTSKSRSGDSVLPVVFDSLI